MAEHRALRTRRRSRRVHDDGDVAHRHLAALHEHVIVGHRIHPAPEILGRQERRPLVGSEHDDVSQVRCRRKSQRRRRLVREFGEDLTGEIDVVRRTTHASGDEQYLHVARANDVSELAALEPCIDRHGHRPDSCRGEFDGEVFRILREKDAHLVPLSHTERHEGP